jgi:hypothetical protein
LLGIVPGKGSLSVPFWLRELRSKIWNCKEDLKRNLIREVKVTRAHFYALQKRVKELHPDRDSEDYDGKEKNIRSLKLEFLRAIAVDDNKDRVDHDHDPEANNEDDSEILSFLPSIVRYLDLSKYDISEIQRRIPSPLFIRDEYDHISSLIEKLPLNITGSVIVSGQPGVGEVFVSPSHRI